MEGVNIGGILLGYVALLVFGLVALVALGLLIAGRFLAARVTFAGGLLAGALVFTGAALTFLQREYRHDDTALIVLAALTFFLAGVGPFVGALRGPWPFAGALGCVVTGLLLLTITHMGGSDFLDPLLGALNRHLGDLGLPLAAACLLLAAAGIAVAFALPAPPRRTGPPA